MSYSKKVCEHVSRYNPLYICGGVGLGKTHLLNATAGLELQNENNVMFISTERFMYHFIKSIKKNEMINLRIFRKSSIFIIDDIQFISAKSLQRVFILLIA